MTHVDEIRARWPDAPDRIERLPDAHVRRMRLVAQRIDDKHLDTRSGLDRLVGHFLAVRHVGKTLAPPAMEDEAVRHGASMRQGDRNDARRSEFERSAHFAGIGPHVGPEPRSLTERVRKDTLQIAQRGWRGIHGHRAIFDLAEPPQIIEAQHVVHVRMRVDNGIQLVDPLAQALRAEVRRRVHAEPALRRAHMNRRPQALVAGVLRETDRAAATDDGDSMRSARAQKCDFDIPHRFSSGAQSGIVRPMSATLVSLRIRHLALVDDLLWEPPPGCVAVTGETGAGKSVILGAVKLLLGERADRSLIRSGHDTCSVEGVFAIASGSPVPAILENHGVEPCEDGQLLLKRTIAAAGTGRQFVNGSPCTLALLKELGDGLVDLHGPHDHQSLFSKEMQLALLDRFAGADELRAAYDAARKAWLALVAEKERLETDAEALARETDLLTHQVAEIEAAALVPGEEEPLVARQKAASHARRLAELCAALRTLIEESEDSLSVRISEAARLTREMSRLDERAASLSGAADELHERLEDFARDLAHYADSLDADPAALAAVESRLDLLQGLKRKYGRSVEAVIAFGAEAAERLKGLTLRGERGAGLDAEIAAAARTADGAATALTKARTKAAPKLEKLVRGHLADLGFAKCGFQVALEPLADRAPQGAETVEFLFSPNPGEAERPLRAIASSGEISRVMLALKTALAREDAIPVLIFDEIDANVGGEIGAMVGAKMRELGSSHQVFCITHLPQVAAAAQAQFLVQKEIADGRTVTRLHLAEGREREEEIARMLGGKGTSALAHARTLLEAR